MFPSDSELVPDTWYNITPTHGAPTEFSTAFFLTADKGWISGQTREYPTDGQPGWGGRVYRTDNGGVSWQSSPDYGNVRLVGVHFFDDQRGIVMRRAVSKSNNGGASWQKVFDIFSLVREFEFSDESTGWAASDKDVGNTTGVGPTILKSIDSGNTWVVSGDMTRQDWGGVILGISAPSSSTIYGVGWYSRPNDRVLLLVGTKDGGNTWMDLHIPPEIESRGDRFTCINFVNESNGWIGGQFRTILHTTDGGATWFEQNAGVGPSAITGIDAIDENHAIAVTSAGEIFVTRDGGVLWEEQQLTIKFISLSSVFYHESGIAYAMGNDGVLKAKISR